MGFLMTQVSLVLGSSTFHFPRPLASRVQMLIQDSGGYNRLFFRKILTRDVLSPPQTERRHSHSQ